MHFNSEKSRALLTQFDFATLFIEELGWDRHNASLSVDVAGLALSLQAVAEKRGMVVWVCEAPVGQKIPDRAARKKIEHQVAKTTLEHLIIFIDDKRAEQIWCWARREAGKPASVPEHFWFVASGNRGFLQKLESIAFSLAEENSLTLVDVTARARAAFDVERVTKRFYDQFKTEHKAFLDFITGITEVTDREWYASLMLNRLMFIYFMQRKGFLNGEQHYLRDRLARCQRDEGQDKFYSFYRYFLLRLFHEGLGGKARNPELDRLLGRIPYLNGGLFEKHAIEERCPEIKIPDEAFSRIFAYFDRYQWHLDERPLRNDDEINPDVLGYIFEKYINQKQMGAYYTKEDITEYIAKNTLVPFLLNAGRSECRVAFENDGGPVVWDHLRDDPDRYIFPAVQHGTASEFPAEIARGLKGASARDLLNRAANEPFGHPTESWREVLARRKRYADLREKLAAGEVRSINALIALNLDVRQFAQDLIERCEGPDLLRAVWKAIQRVTVLDPTCGSGAFLFAALNILEPLYESCLSRMEAFVADLDRADEDVEPSKYEDFKAVLARVSEHPNARYYTLKSIILNNLFGVDIMEEATEICKLRLFLKLAAQVDPDLSHDNLGIEPLPDIDFNIRAGNTLVGYANYSDVGAGQSSLDLDNQLGSISDRVQELQQAFNVFRTQQISMEGGPPPIAKAALRESLSAIASELNAYLARQNGVDTSEEPKFEKWKRAQQPFHWFLEFWQIMEDGGFDVIIGNPPYAEVPKELDRRILCNTYRSALERWSRDEDLCTLVVERSVRLLRNDGGQFGMILPLSVSFSTKRPFRALRGVLQDQGTLASWSHFDRIPSALFSNEVRTRCSILLISRAASEVERQCVTTAFTRWNAEGREQLFSLLRYAEFQGDIAAGVPKLGSVIQSNGLKHLLGKRSTLAIDLRDTLPFRGLAAAAPNFPQPAVYVGGTAYNWFPAWREIPTTSDIDGKPSLPARTAGFRFSTVAEADIVFALLCSSLGYWWWAVASDGFNLKKWLLDSFPISVSTLPPPTKVQLASLGAELREALRDQYVYKDNKGRIGNFYLPNCFELVERIDDALQSSGLGVPDEFFRDIRESNAVFCRTATDALGAEEEAEADD